MNKPYEVVCTKAYKYSCCKGCWHAEPHEGDIYCKMTECIINADPETMVKVRCVRIRRVRKDDKC